MFNILNVLVAQYNLYKGWLCKWFVPELGELREDPEVLEAFEEICGNDPADMSDEEYDAWTDYIQAMWEEVEEARHWRDLLDRETAQERDERFQWLISRIEGEGSEGAWVASLPGEDLVPWLDLMVQFEDAASSLSVQEDAELAYRLRLLLLDEIYFREVVKDLPEDEDRCPVCGDPEDPHCTCKTGD